LDLQDLQVLQFATRLQKKGHKVRTKNMDLRIGCRPWRSVFVMSVTPKCDTL